MPRSVSDLYHEPCFIKLLYAKICLLCFLGIFYLPDLEHGVAQNHTDHSK